MIAKILLSVGELLAIALLVLVILRVKNDQEVSKIWRSLEGVPAENHFTKDMVAELPAPCPALLSSYHCTIHSSCFFCKPGNDWQF
jgi:hypothetical protein